MKVFLNTFMLLILCAAFNTAHAQRIMVLEKAGTFKNYKYFVGDEITVKTLLLSSRQSGIIQDITDTSILINFDHEIMLQDIHQVLRPRWGLGFLSGVTRLAGIGYLAFDIVNNALREEMILDKNTVFISGRLVIFSYVLVPFHYRRIKTGEKWRVKVLNMSMDEEVPNPFLK